MEIKLHHSIICRLLACLERQSFEMLHFTDYTTLKEAVGSVRETILDEREARREVAKDPELNFKNKKKLQQIVPLTQGKPQPMKMARDYLIEHPKATLPQVKSYLIENHITPNSASSTISKLKKRQTKE